jgi:plasmid replication initiation protein
MKNDPSAGKSKELDRLKKGYIKAQSDFFRSARYGLTLQEHRVIYWAILTGQQNGKPFEPVTLAVKDFAELFELKGGNYYNALKNLSDKLVGRAVDIGYHDDNGHHVMKAPWLTSITYNARFGTVTLAPNKALKRFFEGKPFTTTEYYFLIRFTSQYAERLYELLKSMPINKKAIVDFTPSELADKLVVPASYRKNYTDLKRFALGPAVDDIIEFTDLDVTLKEKRGKFNKVDTVYFSVKKKDVPKLADRIEGGEFAPPLSEEEQIRFLNELTGEDFTSESFADCRSPDTHQQPQLPPRA